MTILSIRFKNRSLDHMLDHKFVGRSHIPLISTNIPRQPTSTHDHGFVRKHWPCSSTWWGKAFNNASDCHRQKLVVAEIHFYSE